MALTVTIHEADKRQQNFGQVSNAFVRIVNCENEEEIIRYDLTEDFFCTKLAFDYGRTLS